MSNTPKQKYEKKKRGNAGLRKANAAKRERLEKKDAEIAKLKSQLAYAKKLLGVSRIRVPKGFATSSSSPTSPTRLPKSLPGVPVPKEPAPVNPLKAELRKFKHYLCDYWIYTNTSQGVSDLDSNIKRTIEGLKKFGFTDYAEQVEIITKLYDPETSELSIDRHFHKAVGEHLGGLKLKLSNN